MNSRKIGFWQLFVLALLLNFVAQMIRETGHWAVYQAYGRGPVWGFIGLVQLWDTTPLHPAEWVKTSLPDGEQGWLRLASPTNSKRDTVIKQIGLALTLITSFAMTLYYLRSPFRTGGDEYGIAVQLGIAKSVIEVPFAIAFIACLIFGLRELDTWKTRLTWLALILFSSVPTGLALNYVDTLVRSQVNERNPLFLPVIGFSLPVIIVSGLVFLESV